MVFFLHFLLGIVEFVPFKNGTSNRAPDFHVGCSFGGTRSRKPFNDTQGRESLLTTLPMRNCAIDVGVTFDFSNSTPIFFI